jgi:hypothetical protein
VSGRAAGEGGSGEAEDAEAEAEAEYALPEEESDPECDDGGRALRWLAVSIVRFTDRDRE